MDHADICETPKVSVYKCTFYTRLCRRMLWSHHSCVFGKNTCKREKSNPCFVFIEIYNCSDFTLENNSHIRILLQNRTKLVCVECCGFTMITRLCKFNVTWILLEYMCFIIIAFQRTFDNVKGNKLKCLNYLHIYLFKLC